MFVMITNVGRLLCSKLIQNEIEKIDYTIGIESNRINTLFFYITLTLQNNVRTLTLSNTQLSS